ncbi:MAG TPA: hypothetical protein VGB95_02005 [Chitinophagales bacterium]
MQHQIDLFLFFAINITLICWCVLVFQYKGEKTFGLRLSKKQILWLFVIELFGFVIMYVSFEVHKSPDVADGFAWHYSIIYARGVMILLLFTSINDKIFSAKDPVFTCFISALIFDYFLLLLCSTIMSFIKPKENAQVHK